MMDDALEMATRQRGKNPGKGLCAVERETGKTRAIESGEILLTCTRIEAQRKTAAENAGSTWFAPPGCHGITSPLCFLGESL